MQLNYNLYAAIFDMKQLTTIFFFVKKMKMKKDNNFQFNSIGISRLV